MSKQENLNILGAEDGRMDEEIMKRITKRGSLFRAKENSFQGKKRNTKISEKSSL